MTKRDKELLRIFYSYMNAVLKHPERKKSHTSEFQSKLRTRATIEGYFDFLSFDFHQWSSTI